MIGPTVRGVWVAAAGVPAALVAGLVDEALWIAGPAWVCTTLLLLAADAALCRRSGAFAVSVELPGTVEVGREARAVFRLQGRPPGRAGLALEADERLEVSPAVVSGPGGGPFAFTLWPRRRGTLAVERMHLRWTGPLGLVRRIEVRRLHRPVLAVPQISRVREEALRFFSRDRQAGAAAARDGVGSAEFHALREFQPGDDRRQVNWRHSARHATLLVRETEAERNRTVFVALDTGRLMSDSLADGLPRLDHAIHAGLLLAYACLKTGDRVGLVAFDARPVLASGTVSGPAAFGSLQRLVAGLEYSAEETNFTLGLSGLSSGLGTRSLVVVFTDFADPTGAELMVEAVGRLLQRHLVVFVAFRDEVLQRLADAAPDTAEDVARAVVAGTLLAERDAVLVRLRRIGVDVLETPAGATGPALISRYLELRRGLRL